MKTKYIIGILLAAGASLTSCNDFLNDNRYPLSQQTANSEFWNNSVNAQNQINEFYNDYAGYGNRSSTNGTFYYSWLSDDQCGRRAFSNWTYINVPASSSSWNDPYTEIRRANLVIEGVEGGTISDQEKPNLLALARLHRARNYFNLVKCYGDVPLVEGVLDPSSPELQAARTPRNEVMDYVLEDLDYAVANIAQESSKTEFSSDLAQAIKAEICLFEGAYAKYHNQDTERANKYFNEAVKAGEAIADKYPIGNDYSALYKSFRTAGGGYDGLTANKEVIFMKAYEQGVFMHSLVDYSSASDGVAGLTKDAFDSYIFIDGKAANTTSRNTSDLGTPITGGVDLSNVLAERDQRLAMTTYPRICMPGMAYEAVNTQAMVSQSGYGVSKYNNFTVPNADVNTANKNYTCAPLYWGARLYLAILEAKAELGSISDTDITKYFKPLWDRAGIDTANLNKAWLENMGANDNDMNVSSLIWEIRRCRRCELIMDDGVRYWDLIRWHQLDKLDTTTNPAIAQGANISNSPVSAASTIGNYLDCTYGMTRKFDNKYYFYPVPSGQLSLNSNLTQNPGW